MFADWLEYLDQGKLVGVAFEAEWSGRNPCQTACGPCELQTKPVKAVR